MKLEKNKVIYIVFWILIIVGILVRIYQFPNAISEMNSDEIMTAVNAKSIADTGKELGGITYPVYLQGWGGQSVVLLYLMSLAIKIIGYSLFAVRLPTLIISIISMFVFYDFVKKISKNDKVALIGLGLVVISPWHILQSIWSLDCNMFPHFLLIAMDLLYTGISSKKKMLIYISMISFAVTLYCYGVAIYFVPLFLIIVLICLLREKNIKIKDIVICAMIFTIFSMPIVTMFVINVLHINTNIEIFKITIPYYENLSRTKDMIFFTPDKLTQLFNNILSTLKVIFIQVDGAEWNSSKLFGTTYRISIIFMIIAFVNSIRKLKKEKENVGNFMLITWISISLLTGVIINQANINRLNSIWYPLLVLAAYGIYEMYNRIKYKKLYQYAILFIYIVIFISYITYFYSYYVKVVDNSGCFSRGFYKSLTYIKEIDKTEVFYDNIKNDGCLELYINVNNDSTKKYYSIKDEEELKRKIENIKENEIVIVDMEYRETQEIFNGYQIDDYLIISK